MAVELQTLELLLYKHLIITNHDEEMTTDQLLPHIMHGVMISLAYPPVRSSLVTARHTTDNFTSFASFHDQQ
jgi:hypothetical protein